MRVFFIIIGVALVGFMVWCAQTQQPKKTNMVNLASLMLTLELIRNVKKKTKEQQ